MTARSRSSRSTRYSWVRSEAVRSARGDDRAASYRRPGSGVDCGDPLGGCGVLDQAAGERPELATAQIVDNRGGIGRTLLHVVTDWPGYYPNGPDTVALLLAAGADPDANTGGGRPETPLHWAASSDDLDVAEALIDGGATDDAGGSIGTPLENAVGYGCWHVARLLYAQGARADKLWVAAGLGLLPLVREHV